MMASLLRRTAAVLALGALGAPAPGGAQLLQQSELTFDDADPSFELTLEQVAADSRWLGLSPRQITWSSDGEWVYFRWREDPEPDQVAATDPWYAVDRDGAEARRLSDEEAALVPAGNRVWSMDRGTAAWSRDGRLFVWRRGAGAREVYATGGGLRDLAMAADGSRVFFATLGSGGGEGGDDVRSDDLWAYETGPERVRQIAEVVPAPEERDDADEWLRDQQLELFETLRERERDREAADSVDRVRGPPGPQPIPVESGAAAREIRRSPDGRHLVFQWVKPPGGDDRTYYLEYVNESGEAEPRTARPKVGRPMPEYRMGIVRVDPMVPADSVEVVWVDDGIEKETVIHGPFWNPQGTVAVVQILSMDHKDKWIARLDVETGEAAILHHEHQDAWIGGPLVGGRWSPGYLQWLPEGDAFGFVSAESGWSMLYLATLDGTVTPLTEGEWEVRGAELSADGETWYLVTSREHPGEEHLYHLPARGGALERVTTGEGMHDPEVSPDGGRVATTFETRQMRADLYLQDNRRATEAGEGMAGGGSSAGGVPGAEARRVTKSGTDAYYRYGWATSEIITYADPEGLPTWAEVWERPERPNGASVVHAHGCGECAQAVDKGWGGRTAVYANYLRQNGYVAASVDYRGSAGYGHANRTYAYRQMGISDVDSALPLLDILADRYGVDRERIGLFGCSYGGFFTLMSLFRHPGAYAAGSAHCSVTDWAHYNRGYTSRILNGSPVDDAEAYRRSSPVYYAEGLEDALQIQHGLIDGNVQIQDVFRLTQRLIELGKDFDLVVFPVEGHGWRTEASRLDSYRRMTQWFDRHLSEERVTAATGQP
ncbi:MAG: prolyl oligopeptidase family serine peptidase [Gemmatimonadota bacterium]